VTTALADKVYRWVDEQGNVHYSQSPPPGMATKPQAVDVTVKPADPAAVQNSQDLQQQMQQDAQDPLKIPAQNQADAARAMRRAQCAPLRQRLSDLQKEGQSGQATRDATGRRGYANVANRNREIQQLQSQIANQC
jgi:hypothetical protein